jgi:hypothetical protein
MKSEEAFWLNHLGRLYHLADAVTAVVGGACGDALALQQEAQVVARLAVLDDYLSLAAFREAQRSVVNDGFDIVVRHSEE